MIRWFWGIGPLVLASLALASAQEMPVPWRQVQVKELCFQIPGDWVDLTSMAELFESELMQEWEGAHVETLALFAKFFLEPPDAMAFFMMATLTGVEDLPLGPQEEPPLKRWEAPVAGVPGVWEIHPSEEPPGQGWIVWTQSPLIDGRYLVLILLQPATPALPDSAVMGILSSVAPCPPAPEQPAVPPCACEERIVALEQAIHQMRTSYEAQLQSLQSRVEELVEQVEVWAASRPLKIGVVDAEAAFQSVFLSQVAAERAALEAKIEEIQALHADFAAGRIEAEAYPQLHARLQAELVQLRLEVISTMLEKMLASPGFVNLRAELQGLRARAAALRVEVAHMLTQAREAPEDVAEFAHRLNELSNAVQELDQWLTQVAAAKILEITQQVAREQGFDLVLRTKDVVMYQRAGVVLDLTPVVEAQLRRLFP